MQDWHRAWVKIALTVLVFFCRFLTIDIFMHKTLGVALTILLVVALCILGSRFVIHSFNPASVNTVVSSTTSWKTYINSYPAFSIQYPSEAAVSNEVPPSHFGQWYVSGTPAYYFGTAKVGDLEASVGKPIYAALIVEPTQCLQSAWGSPPPPTSSVEIAGIPMELQDYSNPVAGTHLIFAFKGNPSEGWDNICNTIEIIVPPSQPSGSPVSKQLWQSTTYQNMLSSFKLGK